MYFEVSLILIVLLIFLCIKIVLNYLYEISFRMKVYVMLMLKVSKILKCFYLFVIQIIELYV